MATHICISIISLEALHLLNHPGIQPSMGCCLVAQPLDQDKLL